MNEVYRKEKKFLINKQEHVKYISWLEKIMIQDPHNGKSGYRIRSLYFDTLNDQDYEGKEMGIQVRRKIRLRNYDPKQDYAMLEIKQKDGDYQLKRSLKMNKEDCMEMIKGNYEVLLKYKEPFAKECYGIMQMQCYRPKAIVEYKRKAFIAKENEIRITFDYDIGICYNIGAIPAEDKSYSWWAENAKKFCPERNSRLGTRYEYIAFLAVLIKKLMANGWSVENAWYAVCNDSRELGHYRNSKNARCFFESTDSRETYGFFGLANTYKILAKDKEYFDRYWLASGSYWDFSNFKPLANMEHFSSATFPHRSVGWVVIEENSIDT